jgi:virginiamycin B lyase
MKRSLLLLLGLVGALAVLVPHGASAPPAPASLAFTPTTSAGTYDFGTHAVGASVSQTFTLRNSGGSATGALTISLTGSTAFTKTADSCTAISLGAGKSCSVTVQYNPSGPGASDTAQLNATNGKKKGLATASLTLAGAGAIPGHIYWVNGSFSIARADRDGSNKNLTFIGGDGSFADAINVAVDANHVYWTYTNFETGAVARADLDGNNRNLTFVPTGRGVTGVAVDTNYIYWANSVAGTIGRANLDGSNPNPAFIAATIGDLSDVAVDANYIYWTSYNAGTIGRANLDGSNPNPAFITGLYATSGVTVDANHIYWAKQSSEIGSNLPNAIGRANLDGSNPDQTFIVAPGPYDVAVDSNYVYWTEHGSSYAIGRASLDGSNPNHTFITGVFETRGISVGD